MSLCNQNGGLFCTVINLFPKCSSEVWKVYLHTTVVHRLEESDEPPNKKPKVTESDNIVIYAGSNRNTENGKLESRLKPGE